MEQDKNIDELVPERIDDILISTPTKK